MKTIPIFLFFVALVAISIAAFRALLLIFIGIVFAVFVRNLAVQISKRMPLTQGISLTIIWIILVTASITSMITIEPVIADHLEQFAHFLPEAISKVESFLSRSEIARILLGLDTQSHPISIDRIRESLPKITWSAFEMVGALLIVFFVALYGSAEPKTYVRGFMFLVPISARPKTAEKLQELNEELFHWFLGRLVSMAIVAIMVTTGLWLLDMPLAFTLGIIAGLLDFIPNFGPFLAAAPAIAIAFAINAATGLAVIGLYTGVQIVEAYVLYPIIMRKAVHLPPLLVIAAQLIMGLIAGPLGFVLADPIVLVTRKLVSWLYVENVLGDKTYCRP